ncbi:MAG TPA: tetratricopeptide repeat protein [Pyrinomonadaceae bacterium]
MIRTSLPLRAGRIAVLVFCIAACPLSLYAQSGENLEQLKERAVDLINGIKYTEALPLLEQIVAAAPKDARMQFYLGFALQGQATTIKDDAARRALRVRARAAFLKAKELGINEPIIDGLIDAIPADGNDSRTFSPHVEANALMLQAESKFSQGKLDEALANYQRALKLDPNLYYAALFSGDVFTHKGDYAQAEIWYQKAISIDPMIETAYRYSATPLMKQRKHDEALGRYIEAFITQPYSRFALAGITQWAQVTNSTLAHPQIDVPTDVTFDAKGNANINLDAAALTGKDDGSFAWLAYGGTRSTWRKEKFAKMFPGEAAYRHSLPEEVDALRSVLALATVDKKVKTLSPSLALLKKLNDEGLLEAYILLARIDEGLAKDYVPYLTTNRAKLIRYVREYVVRKQ